jgi:diaminopimelate epimerase
MTLTFTKMNGAGNDFVVMDNRDNALSLTQSQIAALCDRHRGVGADGVMLVEPTEGDAIARMRYYNADGGEAEMCGNGARCFAKFVNRLHDHGLTELRFETMAGLIVATFPTDQGDVCVQLSDPFDWNLKQTLALRNGEKHQVHSVNTGVPHAVVFVDDVQATDIVSVGGAIRYHDDFAPAGTNANAAQVLANQELRIRTYERGVEDETLACGTGMAACALVHHQLTGAASPVAVHVAGGDTLAIGFETANGVFHNVTLTGPADFVFEGTIEVS